MFKRKAIFVISILIIFIILLLVYRGCKEDPKEEGIAEVEISEVMICGISPHEINEPRLDTVFDIKSYSFDKEQQVYQIKLVLEPEKLWKSKPELLVYFRDRLNQKLKDSVITIANTWSKHANIKFKITNTIYLSNIRVSFREKKGYYALVGKDAMKTDDSGAATLWLQDLDKQKDDEKFKSVVLHEFGHAIGLLHELQSPNNNIDWNKPAVYTYFKEKYNMDTTSVDKNIFAPKPLSEFTVFDPESIMIYAIPASLTNNNIEIPESKVLSRLDRLNIKTFYPF